MTIATPAGLTEAPRQQPLRLSWSQPEDLVAHAINAAAEEGRDLKPSGSLGSSGTPGSLGSLRNRWVKAGGSLVAAVTGATPESASTELRAVARELLRLIDELPLPTELAAAEPDDIDAIEHLAMGATGKGRERSDADTASDELYDRIHGAWLGRAAGCLLGKPVEKIPRHGIRLIAESTSNWPIASYFTEIGLDPAIAARFPWNRRSRPTSLIENIDGMPEDDDLNFPLIALDLLERRGRGFTTRDVAESWLANLPAGRVFTAERITYRNLLDGYEPELAGAVQNPFRDWIGAQIRTDVYGWVNPANPAAAARLAWQDARLSHRRNGVYGAMFVAAACASALVTSTVDEVLAEGLGVIPPRSRYAQAIRCGIELAHGPLGTDDALDALYAEYGQLHWVHVLNNAALLAFALVRGAGDFQATITLAVSGGWDTDSTGATAGSIAGALNGARDLPAKWIDPLKNRLSTSLPGYNHIGFDELANRTTLLARTGPTEHGLVQSGVTEHGMVQHGAAVHP